MSGATWLTKNEVAASSQCAIGWQNRILARHSIFKGFHSIGLALNRNGEKIHSAGKSQHVRDEEAILDLQEAEVDEDPAFASIHNNRNDINQYFKSSTSYLLEANEDLYIQIGKMDEAQVRELVKQEFARTYAKELFNYDTESRLGSTKISRQGNLPTNLLHEKYSSEDSPYTDYELYMRQRHHAKSSAKLGSINRVLYKPRDNLTNPPMPSEATIAMLMAAGAHLGHNTEVLKKSNLPFIYGEWNGIHIISLEKTLTYLKRACKVVSDVSERGGVIVLVGTRDGQREIVEINARRMKGYQVYKRWVPGTLTNSINILASKEKMIVDLQDKLVSTKVKPVLVVVPDLVIFLNPNENKVAISECRAKGIPTIGVIDTNVEQTLVTYPIPANDDSIRTLELIGGLIGRAGEHGLKKRMSKPAK
ncbi:ribosomal protein S2, flavodoxin-like domain-containing protein [Dipodascopsis uninucleata]